MNELKGSLEKLIERAKTERPPAADPAIPIPASVGVGVPAAGSTKSSSAGGGIDSPLTEVSYSSRTYYANKTLTSSDGIFTMVVKPVKQVSVRDALGRDIKFVYAEPT